MPPRKEPKETVIYPASKRKPPPFKPLRPSKVPRTSEDLSSSISRPIRPTTAPRLTANRKRTTSTIVGDEDEDEGHNDGDEEEEEVADSNEASSRPSATGERRGRPRNSPQPSSDSDLPVDVRQEPKKRQSLRAPPASRRRQPSASSSPRSVTTSPNRPETLAAIPSQSDSVPTVPQPLLVRLLYEHFANKTTKIDKHAIQVLQKYVEIFVREAIARSALQKKEDAEMSKSDGGLLDEIDGSWLELEDLEKVAAGMMLDF